MFVYATGTKQLKQFTHVLFNKIICYCYDYDYDYGHKQSFVIPLHSVKIICRAMLGAL